MTQSRAVARLVADLPKGAVVPASDRMGRYRSDWTRVVDPVAPLAVVRAENEAHVQHAVRWAAAYQVPVVTRGAGSGLSAGACAVGEGLVVTTERMREVVVDTRTSTVSAQAGALNSEVKQAARAAGLWYPPDPSSYEICTIGGNVATNAGGLCCVKYGVTSDYVLGLDAVLSDGNLVSLGGPRLKDVAGLSLTQLFVGSEGTLGIITRVLLRLVPPPAPAVTLVATFARTQAAAQAVVATRARLRPAMLELMDATSIGAVEDLTGMGLDRAAGALLVVQCDSPGGVASAEVATVEAICRDAGATDVVTTDDPDEGEMFVHARRSALPALERRGAVLLEDVGVPVPSLPRLLDAVDEIARHHDTEIAVLAHAGDGNTHPVLIHDASDPASVRRAHAAFGDVMAVAVALDGTITGEHGVGRTKRDALPAQLGTEVMELNRRVRKAVDPEGLFNPGVMWGP